HRHLDAPDLHSFPTRRSSDLAYVDENAINNVSKGQSVDIHIDAYSDTSFTGHVNLIVQAAAGQFSLLPNQDPTSGNFTKVGQRIDRKSTRLNSSHRTISYAVF